METQSIFQSILCLVMPTWTNFKAIFPVILLTLSFVATIYAKHFPSKGTVFMDFSDSAWDWSPHSNNKLPWWGYFQAASGLSTTTGLG